MNNFISELWPRIARRLEDKTDYPSEEYQTYVRWMRYKKGLNRQQLAELTGLDSNFLAFLENGGLYSKELTHEIEETITKALGISFEAFMQSNGEEVRSWIKEWNDEMDKAFDDDFSFDEEI